jgi:hypothetical protein
VPKLNGNLISSIQIANNRFEVRILPNKTVVGETGVKWPRG